MISFAAFILLSCDFNKKCHRLVSLNDTLQIYTAISDLDDDEKSNQISGILQNVRTKTTNKRYESKKSTYFEVIGMNNFQKLTNKTDFCDLCCQFKSVIKDKSSSTNEKESAKRKLN